MAMAGLAQVSVEMSVVVGAARLPIRDLLKMGRGATIPLGASCDAPSELHVGGVAVALGRIDVRGDRIAVEVIQVLGSAG